MILNKIIKEMRIGDVVLLLPHNPIVGKYGITHATVVSIREYDVDVQLCCHDKIVVKSLKNLLTVINKSQCPDALKKYLVHDKTTLYEVVQRLDRIEHKLTQMGISMGFGLDKNDPMIQKFRGDQNV